MSYFGGGSKNPKAGYEKIAEAEAVADVSKAVGNAENYISNEATSLINSFDAKAEKLRKEGKSMPRTLLQKFLFLCIAFAQSCVVYMILNGIDFGIPALATTGGALKLEYALLIFGSFALSFASFIASAVLVPGTPLYSSVVLGIDASNTTVGTALVGALGGTWGAEGDIITLLKYLIQYQVFVAYVNVGFTFVFTQPHIEFPDFLTPICEWFDHLDDHFNYCIAPIVALGGSILWLITWPIVKVWDIFCFCVGWFCSLFSPLKYWFAMLIIKIGVCLAFITDAVLTVCGYIKDGFLWICDTIQSCFISIGNGISYAWNTFLVYPAVWFWESVIVAGAVFIKDSFFSCMKAIGDSFTPIGHCIQACEKIAEYIWEHEAEILSEEFGMLTARDTYGWLKKEGHFRTNWLTRFYTLKKGTLRYFSKSGDLYPPQGQDEKGVLNLHEYGEAIQFTDKPLEIHLPCNSSSGKNYKFALPTADRARAFKEELNSHIRYSRERKKLEGMETMGAMASI